MRIKNPTKFEVEGLKGTCEFLNCSMNELIDAIMSYCIRDELGKQIEYNRMNKSS